MVTGQASAQRAGSVLPILGNTAKSLHIGGGRKAESVDRAKAVRYALQQAAGRLLFDPIQGKRQKHRVCHCCRSVQGDGVGVYRQADGEGARFGGVATCGSGWACPVCALKISEARREELSAGLVTWTAGGGLVYLMTYTFPHDAGLSLAEGLDKLTRARQRMKNSRDYKALAEEFGRVGSVTSLEVTHGANGWHPHLHELVFVAGELGQMQRDRLVSRWVKCLVREGLGMPGQIADMVDHALDIRGGEDASAYITKYGREEAWGITSELTRSHTKRGRVDHRKPFGLLADFMTGDQRAGALFVEFAEAVHGKRLLTWSPGLRKRLTLAEAERSDEDIAADPLPEEARVGWVTKEQWGLVLSRDARAELLSWAREWLGGPDPEADQLALDWWISELEKRPRRSKGWFMDGMRPKPEWMH